MSGELLPFPSPAGGLSSETAKECAESFLRLPVDSRGAESRKNHHLCEPETLLALCGLLHSQMETSPLKTRADAHDIYASLAGDQVESFLFDEREYFLGELSLLGGIACRVLGEQEEARRLFDCAETWFLLTISAAADLSRVAYQRLAVRFEQREFEEIRLMAPPLREAFLRNGNKEHALKCRYLEAAALKETDRLSESLEIFENVAQEARELGSSRILSPALVAIIQIHSELGDVNRALSLTSEATLVLRESNNRVALAKLQWGLANLLRQTGKFEESIGAFRTAKREFEEIGLRADVAAVHLVLGDLLLETGQERQAEWEIRAALPIIDELKMVPEGFAAMSLLRESLRRRSIDRGALRKVHGYFEEIGS